jgi:hypothetical protein
MTDYPVYITSTKQAERAVAMSAAKKAALKHIDRVAAEKRGEVKQVRTLDGLGLLHKNGEITDDMHRVGQKYHKAFVMTSGLTGKNVLDRTPGGSVDDALQAIVDAGRLVSACEACCTTTGEKAALRSFIGLGDSIRSKVSGRKHREMTDLVISVLAKMVDARI